MQLKLFEDEEDYKKKILRYIDKKQLYYISLNREPIIKNKKEKENYYNVIATLNEIYYEILNDLIDYPNFNLKLKEK